MTKNLFTFIALLLCAFTSQAQQRLVNGRVVDSQGEPLEGVTIIVEDQKRFTQTGPSGRFEIEANPGENLIFSLIGFERQTVRMTGKKEVNVIMRDSKAFAMSDLVVTGYSRQERRDLTGSVSSVKPKDNIGFQSIDQMLQGAAPGVFMSNSSGQLGGANILTIRGISSIMGDTNPLYVIDGVPVYSTDRGNNLESTSGGAVPAASMSGSQVGGGSMKYNYSLNYSFEKNPLAALNPDDIESIEILKDAFATAIYGSRGANGVILITTKKGSRDKTTVNVGYTLSLDRPMGKLNMLNGDDYAMIYNSYYNTDQYRAGINTDWQDAVMRTAISNSTNASISGGKEKINYYLSLNYDNNQSYIINNDMQRFSARLNLNADLSERWKMGMNVSLSRLNNNAMQASSIYSAAIKKAPNLPIYDDSGNYYYGFAPNPKGNAESYNPVAMAYDNEQSVEDTRVVGNAFLQWNPLHWLELKSEIGMDMYNAFTNVHKAELPETVSGVVGNMAQESTKQNMKTVINNTINMSKTWGTHFLQGVIGQSYESARERMNSVVGSDFFSPDLNGVGAAQTKRVISAYTQRSALFSAFMRLNYQWRFRYLAGVTYRLDGSSHFNRNHRYLSTPSFSLGWRMSEESFIKKNLKMIDELKLRGSVGISSKDGNNNYYGAQAVYRLNTNMTYGNGNYLQMSQPGNENLDWERTTTWDAGLDLSMWEGRLKVTLDYYYKKTTNMLFSSDLPLYTGYTKENQNIADMCNQGIDLQIVSTNIDKGDFKWMTILNLSRATNKILKLNFEGNQLDQANSSFKYYAVGYPVAQWYLHKWVGVDPNTGDPLWQYKNGTISNIPPGANYATSQDNKFIMGSALPHFYGSLTNTLLFKNWELDFMFNFAVGSRMINSTKATLLSYTQNDANNLHADILNMWQVPGQQTDMPRLNNASVVNGSDYSLGITTTRFMENNSYLRLKYITLSYNVPQSFLRKTRFLKQLRLFATLTNVFTVTPYTGLDPEVSAYGSSATAAGYDNGTMPSSRSYQFGLRAAF